MKNLFNSIFKTIDGMFEKRARHAARTMGRRHWLAKTGTLMAGAALTPLLPFDRSLGMAYAAGSDAMDPGECTYWRYCALDGNLCSESGGSMTTCPPGSEASKVAWVGTCHNPADGKDSLVSYNDCCGKPSVNNAKFCFRSEGERPGYRMGLHNDVNWCMADTQKGYHCTVAMVVGMADA